RLRAASADVSDSCRPPGGPARADPRAGAARAEPGAPPGGARGAAVARGARAGSFAADLLAQSAARGRALMALDLKDRVRNVPDWPEEGVTFRDITPLLGDP